MINSLVGASQPVLENKLITSPTGQRLPMLSIAHAELEPIQAETYRENLRGLNAVGVCSGSQLLQPLAVAVTGGVTVSLLLSRVITPTPFCLVRRKGL